MTKTQSMTQSTHPDLSSTVVVGVDGSEANLGALRYAVAEATATGAALKLVHVVPDMVPISPVVPCSQAEVDESGHEILLRAKEVVHELAPGIAVEAWLHHGTRPAELVHGADGARALVVGRDGRPLLERLVRGDTATGVAARAGVPVVEVPADWQPRPDEAERLVVAAVKRPTHAAVLLADAFELAGERDATLVVLHVVESRTFGPERVRETTIEVEGVLRDWRARYPDVKVEVRVVHDRPGDALVEASRTADVVVVGRRGATHLGLTARAVLRSAHCPVRVLAHAERK